MELLLVITPLELVRGGHSAVVLFFVLSGFVLSLPQVRGNNIHYPSYLIKRICRIYLPYVVALMVALLGCWKFHGMDAYDEWFRRTWYEAPTFTLVLQHFLLIGHYPNGAYNTAFWSLVQEMRVSLFFPFLCWFVVRFRSAGAFFLMAVLFSFALFAEPRALLPYESLRTVVCVADFIIGILLSLYLSHLRAWLSKMGQVTYWSLFIVSMALFVYTPWLAFHAHVPALAADGPIAAGGAGIILFHLVDRGLSRLVLGPIVSFLGRISYSLYLLHGTVLFLFAYIIHGRIPLLAWLLPYLGVSILGATVMYRWVELPSISLGKLVAGRFASKSAAAPQAPGVATPARSQTGATHSLQAIAAGSDESQTAQDGLETSRPGTSPPKTAV